MVANYAILAEMHSLSIPRNQVISHSTLSALLSDYARPNDKISELIAHGELLSLRRGLYTLADNRELSRELVANHLHGPSYVSRHWALGYYGLLAEKVTTVTSMCIGRSCRFRNELGEFSYHAIPTRYYSTGQTRIQHDNIAFMIATREKALCDLLVANRGLRIQSRLAMIDYLTEDLRLDEAELASLSTSRVKNIACTGYKQTLLTNLLLALETLP